MISLRIFGTTSGLEIRAEGPVFDNEKDDNLIRLPEYVTVDHELAYLSRRQIGNDSVTWLGVYKPAFEIVSNRGGGFFGSGLLTKDINYKIEPALSLIEGLIDDIEKKIQIENKFTHKLSDYDPGKFLNDMVKPILDTILPANESGLSTNGKTLFFKNLHEKNKIFQWALTSEDASPFSSVFIGDPKSLKQGYDDILQIDTFDNIQSFINSYYKSKYQELLDEKKRSKPDSVIPVSQSSEIVNSSITKPDISHSVNKFQNPSSIVIKTDPPDRDNQIQPETEFVDKLRIYVSRTSLGLFLSLFLVFSYSLYNFTVTNEQIKELTTKFIDLDKELIELRTKKNKADSQITEMYSLYPSRLYFDDYNSSLEPTSSSKKRKKHK